MEETDWCENQKFCFGHVKFEWLFSHPRKEDQKLVFGGVRDANKRMYLKRREWSAVSNADVRGWTREEHTGFDNSLTGAMGPKAQLDWVEKTKGEIL